MRSSEVSTNVVKCSEGLSIRVSIIIIRYTYIYSWSQWPRGLMSRSAAALLLRSWVQIPPGAWIFVCCECRVLSGRGLCDELITCPEESYRLRCFVLCDLETSRMRRPALGRSATAMCAMLHAALHTVSFVHGCFAGKCTLTGSTK